MSTPPSLTSRLKDALGSLSALDRAGPLGPGAVRVGRGVAAADEDEGRAPASVETLSEALGAMFD